MNLKGSHPLGNWSCNPPKGYPRFYSGPHRNEYVHRAVWENVAGRPLPEGWHVHHQSFDRMNFQPHELIAMQPCFNQACTLRCPWTGRFMSVDEYKRLMEIPSFTGEEALMSACENRA